MKHPRMPQGVARRISSLIRPGVATVAAATVVAVALTAQGSTQAATSSGSCPVSQYTMGLRYQQSANAEAAQRQAWRLAKLRLHAIVRSGGGSTKPPAVVTDLDETVLDNTALYARDLLACHDYTTWDTWWDWEVHGTPRLTPGARGFFEYADRHHIAIYYVSDRYSENKDSTMATLRGLGLPQVRRTHVLLYGLSKEERRAVVARHHEIVMLLGDSLADFSGVFDGATPAQQKALERKYAGRWGRRWIMFPNASYGAWSGAHLRAWDAPIVTH